MRFKFIVTLDGTGKVEVEADIARLSVEFRGEIRDTGPKAHPTELQCDLCRAGQEPDGGDGVCRAAANIFELCRYFQHTRSIDQIEMTVIHNDRCVFTSTRKADDALMEMMLVVIAASGCSRFGKLRWAWEFWNYESALDNLFYNLFSAFLVMECLTGEGGEPMERAIAQVHAKIAKVQKFVSSVIEQVKSDFTAPGADAAPNALVAIWSIGDIYRLRTDFMLDRLRDRIRASRP